MIDFNKVYDHLMDASTASNHDLVLKFLADIGVSCADDLEHVDETQFNQLLEYQKPVSKKKLVKLIPVGQ